MHAPGRSLCSEGPLENSMGLSCPITLDCLRSALLHFSAKPTAQKINTLIIKPQRETQRPLPSGPRRVPISQTDCRTEAVVFSPAISHHLSVSLVLFALLLMWQFTMSCSTKTSLESYTALGGTLLSSQGNLYIICPLRSLRLPRGKTTHHQNTEISHWTCCCLNQDRNKGCHPPQLPQVCDMHFNLESDTMLFSLHSHRHS